MMLIICDLALHELLTGCLAVVREIEEVDEVWLFFLDGFPTEVDNLLEA